MAACELTSTALMVFCVVWFNSVWWFLCQKCCLSPGSTKQILARVCKLINVSAPKAPSAALFGDRKSSVKKYGCPVLRDRVFSSYTCLLITAKLLFRLGYWTYLVTYPYPDKRSFLQCSLWWTVNCPWKLQAVLNWRRPENSESSGSAALVALVC